MSKPFYEDSLLGRLDRHAHELRDHTLYTFLRDQGDPQTLTFGQLASRVQILAARLSEHLCPGDRAVLLYPHGPEFAAAFLGCLAAGVIAVPAYPPRRNRKADRLNAIIADCSPAALLTTSAIRVTLPADLTKTLVLSTDEWVGSEREPCNRDRIRPETIAFIQYTSGSTGTPKGVMVTHENIAKNEQQMERSFCSNSQSIVISWLPLFHDMGLIGNLLQPLYVGFPAVLLYPTSFIQKPVRWLQSISDYRGTTTGAPNFAYDLCTRVVSSEQKRGIDLSSLNVLYNGSEPVRSDTLDRFASAFAECGFSSRMFFPCYGMAETTLFVSGGPFEDEPKRVWLNAAALEVGQVELGSPNVPGSRAIVGCGIPADGVDVRIVDPETRLQLPPERVGEIWVRSASVAAGYWNRREDTHAAFENYLNDNAEGPFLATGDLGFINFGEVFISGRLKDLIIIRGRNIYPQDVEAVVQRTSTLIQLNCAAFSVQYSGEEQLCLVVEGDRGFSNAARQGGQEVENLLVNIRAAVSREFDIIVAEIAAVKPGTFPQTSSGKVRRRACRDGLRNGTLNTILRWEDQSLKQLGCPQ